MFGTYSLLFHSKSSGVCAIRSDGDRRPDRWIGLGSFQKTPLGWAPAGWTSFEKSFRIAGTMSGRRGSRMAGAGQEQTSTDQGGKCAAVGLPEVSTRASRRGVGVRRGWRGIVGGVGCCRPRWPIRSAQRTALDAVTGVDPAVFSVRHARSGTRAAIAVIPGEPTNRNRLPWPKPPAVVSDSNRSGHEQVR